jgi:hypothetical protein
LNEASAVHRLILKVNRLLPIILYS